MPTEAQQLLDKSPSVIGANTAIKMKDVAADKVIEIVKKLITKEFATEKEAIDSLKVRPVKAETQVVEIRIGKKVFAKVSHRASTVAIDFRDNEITQEFKSELADLVKKYANH